MARTLRPLGDRVVIEPAEREEMTAGGIIVPETAKEKPQEGTVVAAGPGKTDDTGKRTPLDVQVGDRVLFARYAGTEMKVDAKALLIVRETDILAVIQS